MRRQSGRTHRFKAKNTARARCVGAQDRRPGVEDCASVVSIVDQTSLMRPADEES
ncbi:MAG: hypothetical protein AAF503_03070 [Pseudomonadota bacterium]